MAQDKILGKAQITLYAGRGGHDIVGESRYQKTLRSIAAGRLVAGETVVFAAYVVPEPENQYDHNAIAVYAEGYGPVGYFCREDAELYAPVAQELLRRNAVGVCEAELTGGWDDDASIGVKLGIGGPKNTLEALRGEAVGPVQMPFPTVPPSLPLGTTIGRVVSEDQRARCRREAVFIGIPIGVLSVAGFAGFLWLLSPSETESPPAPVTTPAPVPSAMTPALRRPTTKAKPTTAKNGSTSSDLRRAVRENHSADDSARALIFRSALRKSGQRCDDVESAIMGAPGVWTITCSPGYRYRFEYDRNGNPVGAYRLR